MPIANHIKSIHFCGNALDALRSFPASAKRDAGFQLDKVQHGMLPDDWKPMSTIGTSVKEIRIHDEAGAFRIIYLAKFESSVYVLHCFQKKIQQISRTDIELAQSRYRDLLHEIKP